MPSPTDNPDLTPVFRCFAADDADNDNDGVAAGSCDECGGHVFLAMNGKIRCTRCPAELQL